MSCRQVVHVLGDEYWVCVQELVKTLFSPKFLTIICEKDRWGQGLPISDKVDKPLVLWLSTVACFHDLSTLSWQPYNSHFEVKEKKGRLSASKPRAWTSRFNRMCWVGHEISDFCLENDQTLHTLFQICSELTSGPNNWKSERCLEFRLHEMVRNKKVPILLRGYLSSSIY